MKKRLVFVLLMMLVLTFLLGACGGQGQANSAGNSQAGSTAEQKGKIAYVTGTGNLGDKSFNDLGYLGIKRLMDAGISCDVAEPKSIAEMEGILRNFSETQEYALIIGMGSDMVDSIKKVAADYPEQQYMVVDGHAGNIENIRAVLISQEDTAFLVGAFVGLMEKEGNLENGQGKNVIGVVGGMDIPLIRGIQTAFECGARYVNPEVTVLKTFVGDWADPGTGLELTQDMYEKGASIVFQAAGGSGLGVLEAAEKQNRYAIGYDGNQNSIAPANIIGSGVRGLDAQIEQAALDALAGKFQGGDISITMKDDNSAAQIAFLDSEVQVPAEVLEKLEKIKTFLEEAKVEIPAEPEEVDAYLAKVGSFEG